MSWVAAQWHAIAAQGWAAIFTVAIISSSIVLGAAALVFLSISKWRERKNPSEKSNGGFNQITQVFHKTFANQTVPLDNLEYVDCVFENVTFMCEGKGVARMTGCRFAQNITLKSNNIPVSQTILIMIALAGAMGGKMPGTFRVE